jgi:hypothetical protein
MQDPSIWQPFQPAQHCPGGRISWPSRHAHTPICRCCSKPSEARTEPQKADVDEPHLWVPKCRIRALGIPFSLLSTALGGAFRGLLDTRTPLFVAAAANLVNLILDPILIFGLGPVPTFGASGAAAATVVAEVLAACSLLHNLAQTRVWPRRLELPQLGKMREVLGASGAVLTRTAVLQSTLLLATATVAHHAADGNVQEVAAHQVCCLCRYPLNVLRTRVFL